jgi:hypothetical protein
MKFIFLGDVHCNIQHCINVAKKNPDSKIIQVGDFGVGFVPTNYLQANLPENFYFFVGNHDNRQEAKNLEYNLGDFGEAFKKFFFVSGAESYDKENRIMGVNWWPDEQLTYKQADKCLVKWIKSKCKVLVAHDCPQSLVNFERSLTRNLLQAMVDARKPELIIHGHHHFSRKIDIDGITVKSLAIDETYDVDI